MSVRFVDSARVYNTESGVMMKMNFTREDLEDGWTRFITRSIYYRPKTRDYWMHVEKVTVDRDSSVVDRQDYCYIVDEDYVRMFNKSTET